MHRLSSRELNRGQRDIPCLHAFGSLVWPWRCGTRLLQCYHWGWTWWRLNRSCQPNLLIGNLTIRKSDCELTRAPNCKKASFFFKWGCCILRGAVVRLFCWRQTNVGVQPEHRNTVSTPQHTFREGTGSAAENTWFLLIIKGSTASMQEPLLRWWSLAMRESQGRSRLRSRLKQWNVFLSTNLLSVVTLTTCEECDPLRVKSMFRMC